MKVESDSLRLLGGNGREPLVSVSPTPTTPRRGFRPRSRSSDLTTSVDGVAYFMPMFGDTDNDPPKRAA